jgi:hypothetical protein
MDADSGINIFLERIVNRAYKSGIDVVISLLRNGPVTRRPKLDDLKLHQWYQNLDNSQKMIVEHLVEKTAYSVLFGCLVVLDNQTMGNPIKNEVSDFGLYVQSYENADHRSNNQYNSALRINHPKGNFSLHDLIDNFINKIE